MEVISISQNGINASFHIYKIFQIEAEDLLKYHIHINFTIKQCKWICSTFLHCGLLQIWVTLVACSASTSLNDRMHCKKLLKFYCQVYSSILNFALQYIFTSYYELGNCCYFHYTFCSPYFSLRKMYASFSFTIHK